MFALVDANSFYASAEKVFDPSLRNKPVVVLTNNDGCICAMCSRAKASGVKKFVPYHTVKDQLAKFGTVIRSSNYELYADLSSRMMEVIGRYGEAQHIYSIDESFLRLPPSLTDEQYIELGTHIRRTVWKEVRLPVCVGIGPTTTLAKLANHAAKKVKGYRGVAVLKEPHSIRSILKDLAVDDIWGIGKRLAKRMNVMGIHSALDLAQYPARSIRKQFNVNVERTVRELNGEPCLSWDEVRAPKQQIYSTRAFGEKVSTLTALEQSVALHAEQVARKARQEGSLIKGMVIFAHSNPFKGNLYRKSVYHDFITPTADSRDTVSAATRAAREIYKPGVLFHKSGVGAIELVEADVYQTDLFQPQARSPELMQCMDAINHKYGRSTLTLAVQGQQPSWRMRRQYLSKQYTTRWRDIPVICC